LVKLGKNGEKLKKTPKILKRVWKILGFLGEFLKGGNFLGKKLGGN